MLREQFRTQSTWRTGTLDTSAVTVDAKKAVENTGYMENWRTRNNGHICIDSIDAKGTVRYTGYMNNKEHWTHLQYYSSKSRCILREQFRTQGTWRTGEQGTPDTPAVLIVTV